MLKQPATAIYYPLSCVLAGIDKFAGCRSVAVPSTIERSTSLSRYTRHTVARSIHRTRWSIIASLRLGTFRSFILYVAILLSADRVLPLSPRLDKITWISIVSSLNGIVDVCWNRCQPAADFYSACSNVGKLANLNCNLFSTGGNGGNLHAVPVSFVATRLILLTYEHKGFVSFSVEWIFSFF